MSAGQTTQEESPTQSSESSAANIVKSLTLTHALGLAIVGPMFSSLLIELTGCLQQPVNLRNLDHTFGQGMIRDFSLTSHWILNIVSEPEYKPVGISGGQDPPWRLFPSLSWDPLAPVHHSKCK